MLSKKIFADCIEDLMVFFPNWKVDFDNKETATKWHKYFEHFDNIQFIDTVSNYIRFEKNNPTVAGLIEKTVPMRPDRIKIVEVTKEESEL